MTKRSDKRKVSVHTLKHIRTVLTEITLTMQHGLEKDQVWLVITTLDTLIDGEG